MIVLVNPAHAQQKGDTSRIILKVKLEDFGKSPLPNHVKKIGSIERKYITSAIFVYLDSNRITPIYINDRVFNYDYFDTYTKKGKELKLTVRSYVVDGKEIFVAEHIE